jgi:hypothetical protein
MSIDVETLAAEQELAPDSLSYIDAIHEGGHAVVAIAIGHDVVKATIESVRTRYRRSDPQAVYREAVIAAAGPTAEVFYQPLSGLQRRQRWDSVWSTDRRRINRAGDAEKVFEHAHRLVAEHWDAIERVASALYRHDCLTGFDVEALIAADHSTIEALGL